jgi:hypothetical protein
MDLGNVSNVILPDVGPPPDLGHGGFNYESFYQTIVNQKKLDKSYRYFRSITRLQNQFPFAQCSQSGKTVNVWCSNDYVSSVCMSEKKLLTSCADGNGQQPCRVNCDASGIGHVRGQFGGFTQQSVIHIYCSRYREQK